MKKFIDIRSLVSSFVTAILVAGVSGFGMWIATGDGVGEIGYGGRVWPFVIGLALPLLIAAFPAAMWFASSNKSSDWGGVGVIVILVAISAALGARGFTLNNWDQSQFWWGALDAVVILATVAIIYVHKKHIK